MKLAIFKLPGWQLLLQMDWMATLIILILFISSVFCIGLIIVQFSSFRKNQHEILYLSQQISHCSDFASLINLSKVKTPYLGTRLLRESVALVSQCLEVSNRKKIDKCQLEELELLVDEHISNILVEEESFLSILNIFSMVSPLLGLFGTVWGLVYAFIDIGQQQAADITTIAPGIAMALVTTLAGLIVAIPATAFFHYFTEKMRLLEYNMFKQAKFFLAIIKKSLV